MPFESKNRKRNLIDDIFDLGLAVMMIVWYFTGIELDEKTLAAIGAAGASARATLRRILVSVWGPELGIDEDELEEAASDEPEEDKGPEDEEILEADKDTVVDGKAT